MCSVLVIGLLLRFLNEEFEIVDNYFLMAQYLWPNASK